MRSSSRVFQIVALTLLVVCFLLSQILELAVLDLGRAGDVARALGHLELRFAVADRFARLSEPVEHLLLFLPAPLQLFERRGRGFDSLAQSRGFLRVLIRQGGKPARQS